MDSNNNGPPSVSTVRPLGNPPDSGSAGSLPAANAIGPQHALPTYPSSTLQYYYPSPYQATNYMHITSFPDHSSSHAPVANNFSAQMPLPSASQSHIPSLRQTPSFPSPEIICAQHTSTSPFPNQRNNTYSRTSQRIHSSSPIAYYEQQPVPPFIPPAPASMPHFAPPRAHAPFPRSHTHTNFTHSNSDLSSSTHSLPSTKDVPILNGKHDWGPWHSAVRTLILNSNLLRHIADDPLPGAIFDPGLWPTHPPVIHQGSSHSELQSFSDWWSRDGLASHVLTSRLSSSILGSLPIANERMGQRRSARTVYFTLRHQYGAGDYSSMMIIEACLRQLRCLPSRGGVRVGDFINTWRVSVNQMEAAGFLPGPRQLLSIFADGLPNNTVAFINLYDSIISSLNEPDKSSLPTIYYLFERATIIENNIQRLRILNPNPRRTQPTTTSSSPPSVQPTVPPTTDSAPATTSQVPRSVRPTTRPNCSNCGQDGHTFPTCFQPGGAMEGRREEYLASRVPKPIAHIAEVEESHADVEEVTIITDDNNLNTEFAAMSLTSTNDILFSTYVLASFSEISLEPLALNSISQAYNTALDSACTNHIFRNRDLFHTYNVEGAVPVKTANCGFLNTLGIGDVKIRLRIGDKNVVWTLTNCLHAPDVPINLISVGALQEHHMSVSFSFRKTTISFPQDHPHLSGLSFDAFVARRLSLLNLNFIQPPILPVALHLFPIPQNSPEIWHRRFGHLGHEASKNVITGDYVTGITKPPTPYPLTSKCIPCLIGKSPQTSYSHNAKRASSVGDLIHIDTCGPFPTLTPRKQVYFSIFLDDASNYGVTTLLSNKNDVFSAWKKVEASWELLSGNHIKAVRLDGAKEFTQGALANHLLSRGIVMQVTAPYAHAQAGKAEHYVRTIEDGVQTLLADAKLPLSFWGDAALTTQYLRNRLPTSTLPPNTTPYKIMHGTKPDLSHLWVWGCQCFPAIPPELRTKGGPRRYEAIFVGYEDNRIGWRVRDLAGKYHFSRDVVFNENTPGHLSPTRGLLTDHSLLPPPSLVTNHPPIIDSRHPSAAPHTSHTPLPTLVLADVLHNRDLIARTTRSATGSLPKQSRHYNDIDPLTLFISLNAANHITSPTTPELHTTHTSLLNDCFLSAPLPFLVIGHGIFPNHLILTTKLSPVQMQLYGWQRCNENMTAWSPESPSNVQLCPVTAKRSAFDGPMTTNITLMALSYAERKRPV